MVGGTESVLVAGRLAFVAAFTPCDLAVLGITQRAGGRTE